MCSKLGISISPIAEKTRLVFAMSATALAFLSVAAAFGQINRTDKLVSLAQVQSEQHQSQSKPVIDVRGISGVDCTGATDSSTALNALTVTDGITGKTLSFRGCASIQLQFQWLIKGQEYSEIDLGGTMGTGGQIQGGTTIFGCGGVADAVIRVDDSGYLNFHGGTVVPKGNNCSSSFVGSIRVTNSQTGGYTSTRNSFRDLFLTPATNGTPITGYYGLKIDGSPNQEGFGLHHLFVHCQNSSGSYGIWVNDVNADSTDLDQESNVTNCYQGVRIDAGVLRTFNSHIGGNGSYATFGLGGANFFEAQNGCLQVATGIVAAEASGAFLNGSGRNGAACWRSIFGNQISFVNIDPALYPIRAGGGTFGLWNNDFGNGGAAVTIHNNTIVGDDSEGLYGPQSSVYDLGGNNLNDAGNSSPFQLTFQPFQRGQVSLGRTLSGIGLPIGGMFLSGGTSNGWVLLPNASPPDNSTHSMASAPLVFSKAWYNARAPVLDQYIWREVGDAAASYTTLALAYKPASGYSTTPTIGIEPTISGETFSRLGAPAFSPFKAVGNIGTAGSTIYTYQLVARGGCGTSAGSSTQSTTTGNATLSSTNYNVIGIQATQGAWGIDVYRTAGGATQGKIGTALVTDYVAGGDQYLSFKDTGLPGDGTTAPLGNTSGCMNIPSGSTYQINGSQISSSNLSDGPFTRVYTASLTTNTSGTSDKVSITGITASSHCSLMATNALAANNFASTYVSAKNRDEITVTHSRVSGMTYDILCTAN